MLGKYQCNFFTPSNGILSMHILSEKYRFCSLCKLITCMQWQRGGRLSLVSPLCNTLSIQNIYALVLCHIMDYVSCTDKSP